MSGIWGIACCQNFDSNMSRNCYLVNHPTLLKASFDFVLSAIISLVRKSYLSSPVINFLYTIEAVSILASYVDVRWAHHAIFLRWGGKIA